MGGEWSASRPGRALRPGKGPPGTHWTGGWVGPRAGLDTEERGKILCPCRGSNPHRPVVQPVVRHYTDWATPAHAVSCTGSNLELVTHNGATKYPMTMWGCYWNKTVRIHRWSVSGLSTNRYFIYDKLSGYTKIYLVIQFIDSLVN
jgi:hypothetical protein